MKDWQTSPLAKCRLFSVQDQLCSFADLKQMLSSCRLFRTGGDIQTPQAIKKAVRWNFEILPNNYCDALKNILDIGVFSKEKHIPEIFRMKPDLSDANNRIDLLKKLKAEADKREESLKRFATEYVMLGKECEREGIRDAAIRNYEKALELYPDHPVAKRKIRKLKV